MTHARVLAERLADLLHREQGAMAEFLVALADFDKRRGWLELGHSSLFYFLHRELGLSKGAAHYRKTAAELVQRFPEIVEPLRDGRLCITSIVHLARVLTPENRHEMLPKFFQRSKREAMAVAAALQPASAAPHRDIVTALRPGSAAGLASAVGAASVAGAAGAAVVAAAASSSSASAGEDGLAVQPVELSVTAASLVPKPARRDAAEPLTADLSRLHITVSRRFLEKLQAARAALSHSRPSASAEEILEAGLDLVLRRDAKRKGLVQKPRKEMPRKEKPRKEKPRKEMPSQEKPSQEMPSQEMPSQEMPSQEMPSQEMPPKENPSAESHVPAAVKRQVWTRDGGHCQWPLESGGVCGSTLRVELDHRVPLALGGASTADNVRLLCRVHNDLAARRVFGDEWMNQFTRGAAQGASAESGAESS
jgi:5-methylcytosine-specific restriction endonuclease McrA